ncbi:MAG: choice-of-anchor D domain-containing protein [Granulosicoccus sp.]
MVNKFLLWCGNALLASILVASVTANPVWAQQTGGDSNDTPDATGSGRISVPLSGTATVSRSGALTVTPSSVETGLIDVGSSTSQTVVITHTGALNSPAVVIKDAELFGKSATEFSSSFNGFETLYGGDTIDVTMTFTPLSPGDKAAGLRLSIEGETSPYVIIFTGTARYPLTSDLGSSDAKVVFGQSVLNANNQKNFILTNQGEQDAPAINVSAIQLSGINAGDFNVIFTPQALLPGQQLDIKVDMETDSVGIKSAKAEIFHDGNNGSLEIDFEGSVVTPQAIPVNFTTSTLNANQQINRGTSLQFGPDDLLYVAEMDGLIKVFDVNRNGANNYTATLQGTIDLIKNVPNHNDDGTPDFSGKRLLTGIHVAGTAGSPVIYAASSDPRQAAGPSGNDSNLDTNSGILHKLTKSGGNWSKQDLVRGLPRSEENHVSNGLVLSGNTIYLNVGGHTNQGAPSNNFAELPEYALSAATLEIDLGAIGNSTYDLPTLDGPADQHDPFGGHDGLNQAKLVQNGPVQIFASGLRNAYDIVLTESGRFYVWDNGPNTGWGGLPGNNCSDAISNAGSKHQDGLHLISKGYYAGHPNPTRGSKNNTFGGQTPIEGPADPDQCVYKTPGQNDGSLTTNNPSTNGLDEYSATNFGGAMQGDLLAVAFDKSLYRVQLNGSGTTVTSKSELLTDNGQAPLDVTTQGDADAFPGTIWILDNIVKTITVMEPADY